MRTTITVDQNNIALTRKQFSEQLISALADFGDMSADSEALLLSKFEKVFTNFHKPRKDYGSNRLFQNDLKEALERNAAYTTKPSLQGLPLCYTSRVIVTTPMLIPCIACIASQRATVPLHSPSLLCSTPVLTPFRLSIGK
jgi:hypothetical protein